MDLYIENEYNDLEGVLVHRPGLEVDRLNYHNMHRFLFEDIPYLQKMQEEHDEFTNQLRTAGVRVFYLEQLLRELLETDREATESLVQEVCAAEFVPPVAKVLLGSSLSVQELIDIMFSGLTLREYKNLSGESPSANDDIGQFVLSPIPNAYFSRDPAVVVKNATISCKMHYPERVRETILTRAILEWHPMFELQKLFYGGSDSPHEDRPHTVEGGDVTVLSADALMIGVSERTTWQAIERIAHNAFEIGHMRRMYEVTLPAHRDYMHLDTVFTVIDRGMVVWYPKVMENVTVIKRYEPRMKDGKLYAAPVREDRKLRQILEDEFGCALTVIQTAGGHEHYAAREQRTDGTNVLAVGPRKVIMYDRNFKTKEELERFGVETLCISGSELVRGLGGPRCMSMPLRRKTSPA